MSLLVGKHVLVVEDEYFLAIDLENMITTAGAVVVGPFASLDPAIVALKDHVDIAVLNVKIQDGGTYPLASILLKRGIPFIFASGQDPRTEPEEWQRSHWITKPYAPGEVLGLLERVLGNSVITPRQV